MAKTNKKLAAEILAANPEENQVYIFKDGEAFFSEAKANAYKEKYKLEEEPEVFFREGIPAEPGEVDTTVFTDKIKEQEITIGQLEKAVETLESDKGQLNEALATKDEVIQSYTNELVNERENVKSLTEEVVTLRAVKDKLTAELEAANAQLAKLQKETKAPKADGNNKEN